MFLYSRKEVPQFERFVKRAQRTNLWTMLSERNESKIANAVSHESFMEHRRHAETNPRTREGFLTAAKAGNRPDSTNIKKRSLPVG